MKMACVIIHPPTSTGLNPGHVGPYQFNAVASAAAQYAQIAKPKACQCPCSGARDFQCHGDPALLESRQPAGRSRGDDESSKSFSIQSEKEDYSHS